LIKRFYGNNFLPNIFLSQSAIDDSDVKQQMNIVENGVNYNVKRYNDLKIMNERLVVVLKSKLDELEQQKKSFEALDNMKKVTKLNSIACVSYLFIIIVVFIRQKQKKVFVLIIWKRKLNNVKKKFVNVHIIHVN